MAKKRVGNKNGGANGPLAGVKDYRHDTATRKNNPPAKIAADGVVPLMPKAEYFYSPRRPPSLQFDPTGAPDELPELVRTAKERRLTDDEAKIVAEAPRDQEPWLEWAGKREAKRFEVDPVVLQIHERISAKAILKVAAQQDVERSLFADEQAYHEAVQFYNYDIDWTNRLILGDSLQVMSSLARREDLAGKVQMIYIDPPYGIKFASNFQPQIRDREVKDKEEDLTREPEMIKAYRDTWHLGIHSYLTYLRDRLVVARELLTDSGSVFVQVGEENLHRVRVVMDEVYGEANFVSLVAFATTGGQSADLLGNVFNFLLSYAKDIELITYSQLYSDKELRRGEGWAHSRAELEDGRRENPGVDRVEELTAAGRPIRPYSLDGITSQGATITGSDPFIFQRRSFALSPNSHWKTTVGGMHRLSKAGRVEASKDSIRYVRFLDDFPVQPLTNIWDDTNRPGYIDAKRYVVQTSAKVIERCLLMATEPGDLVLDPTCGSGTTAYVAEQWGRRWITIDTSRVSIAIARQRLLTAKFDYYATHAVMAEDQARNPRGTWLTDPTGQTEGPVTFQCKTVPHVTLKSIAQNTNLDPIFAKHEPILDEKLAACNAALANVTPDTRKKLSTKLLEKKKEQGRKSIADADRRRWELPQPGDKWEHWQAPFDTDPDYPKRLAEAVIEYRGAWRAKMDDVNACIAANAEEEELVDKPEIVKDVLRVSGPFTVESVQPPEMSLGDVHTIELTGGAVSTGPTDGGQFAGEPEELEGTFELRYVERRTDLEAKNVEAYLEQMIRLLRMDAVRFPNNKHMVFSRLEALKSPEPGLQADGRWAPEGQTDADPEGKSTVCVAFGPQYGPVTAKMVEDVIRSANRLGYDDLVIAGFSFDGAAQAVIEEAQRPRLRIHQANIRPDVNPGMNGLLKEQPGSQLFTVFGQPRTRVDGPDAGGQYTVTMEGVDIYNPVDNSITSTGADKVAAWFLDGDYDGRTFCIAQAFFPDRAAWGKLSNALAHVIDPERFEALSGTESLPFPPGKHKSVPIKVIDPRGNEVMQVHKLEGGNA